MEDLFSVDTKPDDNVAVPELTSLRWTCPTRTSRWSRPTRCSVAPSCCTMRSSPPPASRAESSERRPSPPARRSRRRWRSPGWAPTRCVRRGSLALTLTLPTPPRHPPPPPHPRTLLWLPSGHEHERTRLAPRERHPLHRRDRDLHAALGSSGVSPNYRLTNLLFENFRTLILS